MYSVIHVHEMRKKLTRIPSLFAALHHKFNYNHTRNHIGHQLHSLSPYPNCAASVVNDFKAKSPYLTPFFEKSPFKPLVFHASFTSSVNGEPHKSDPDCEFEIDSYEDEVMDLKREKDSDSFSCDLKTIMDILQTGSVQEKSKKLEQCVVNLTRGLVAEVISKTRNNWETAFTFFLWAGKQPGYQHASREYHSMIAILGKFRKFDTAWGLIDDMKAASLVTPQTLLIMIRRYTAVHDVAKAISAFYAHKRFKFEIRMEEFQGMLSALCRYKNVKDAEHLLFCNKTEFPLNTKSFNIILNGWCNVIGSLREGERIWREMEERQIRHDVYSYGSIMSCFSKASRLNLVMKYFDKMKALGLEPDRKVYNAMIHALSKGRLMKEARSVMKTMEEKGFTPDAITYNSLIMPLCKFRLLNEAQQVFDEMLERGLSPSVRTYHAYLRMLRTGEEVFELLEKMHATGCNPSHETYIMLIRKFCRWRQIDNVYKTWDEMKKNGLDPDRSSYIVLIHGLFLNGKLEDARKFYVEMKEKGLLSDPKIDEMLQAWLEGKVESDSQSVDLLRDNELNGNTTKQNYRVKSKISQRENDFRRKPELRSVTRKKGFSFWDH